MTVLGVGVDIVSVQRFAEACERTPGFLTRVLTTQEHEGRSINSLAARFAAKEAIAKALGAPGGMAWHDCEIETLESGQPQVRLTGTCQARAEALGITSWQLSLSHDGGNAIAFVVAS